MKLLQILLIFPILSFLIQCKLDRDYAHLADEVCSCMKGITSLNTYVSSVPDDKTNGYIKKYYNARFAKAEIEEKYLLLQVSAVKIMESNNNPKLIQDQIKQLARVFFSEVFNINKKYDMQARNKELEKVIPVLMDSLDCMMKIKIGIVLGLVGPDMERLKWSLKIKGCI